MNRLLTERLLEAADRVPPLAAHDLRALLEVAADTIIRLDEELVAVQDELVAAREESAPDVAQPAEHVPLNEAVQRAAAELPEGWEIHLCVVRGSDGVDLIGPDGTEYFHTDNERLDYTVIDALEFAAATHRKGDE